MKERDSREIQPIRETVSIEPFSTFDRRRFLKRSGGASAAVILAGNLQAESWSTDSGVTCCPEDSTTENVNEQRPIPEFDQLGETILEQILDDNDVTPPTGWSWSTTSDPSITIGAMDYEPDQIRVKADVTIASTSVASSPTTTPPSCKITVTTANVSGESQLNSTAFTARFPIKKDGSVSTSEIVVNGSITGEVTAQAATTPQESTYECFDLEGDPPAEQDCTVTGDVEYNVEVKLSFEGDGDWSWSFGTGAGRETHSGSWEVESNVVEEVAMPKISVSLSETCGG